MAIPYYLRELVSLFHSYYHDNEILGDDPELTRARLCPGSPEPDWPVSSHGEDSCDEALTRVIDS